jgi:hypothetical protein
MSTDLLEQPVAVSSSSSSSDSSSLSSSRSSSAPHDEESEPEMPMKATELELVDTQPGEVALKQAAELLNELLKDKFKQEKQSAIPAKDGSAQQNESGQKPKRLNGMKDIPRKLCAVCKTHKGKRYEIRKWSNIAKKLPESKWLCDKHRRQNAKLLQVDVYFSPFVGISTALQAAHLISNISHIYVQYNLVTGIGEEL